MRHAALPSSLYAVAALASVTLARAAHRRGLPPALTRKGVHVATGLSPLVLTRVATGRRSLLLPYALTTGVNLLLWRRGGWAPLRGPRANGGIVTLPLAQTLLLAQFWQPAGQERRSRIAVSALVTAALGDAGAALVGRFGRSRIPGSGGRTVEGSLTMAAICGLLLALFGWRGGTLVTATTAATLTEALTPGGLDNLLIPAILAGVLNHGRPAPKQRPEWRGGEDGRP